MRPIPFKIQVALAFGAAVVLLLSIGVLSYRRILQEDSDQDWVEHTHLVIEKLDAIRLDLPGQYATQPEYEVEQAHLESDLAELRNLTSDNPKQQQSVDRIETLVRSSSAGLQGAAATGSGKLAAETIDRIRDVLLGMKKEEQRLLVRRLNSASLNSRRMKAILGAGGTLAIVLLLVASVLVQSEIHKRSRAEQELRNAEERYHRMFDNNPIPAWVYDTLNLAILDVNAEAISHYGYSREEFLSLKITDIRPPEDVAALLENVAEAPHGAENSGLWRHRRKTGEIVLVEIRSYPLVHGDRDARLVVALDVTERNRAEEEMRLRNAQLDAANKELEAFSYSVSHDLRAPLRGIDGFSQALLEDCYEKLNQTERNYLDRIRAGTQRMGLLIDDLLNLSRVARAEMHRERVNLSDLARFVAADLQKSQVGREVELRIESGLEAVGDPRLLRLVYENLLGNAWKFTSKRASACIEVGRSNHDGTHAYFVRDNGAGFDQAYAGKLFGAFQRLHAMNEFPGTGVGLATVQRIIHRHGGKIWAEGAVEKGAAFYFTL